MNDDRSRSRRWHRGPKGADLLDLVFKISSKDGWSATLRNNPSVVLVAENGDELAELLGSSPWRSSSTATRRP